LGVLGLTLPGQITSATTLFDQGANVRAPEEAAFFEGSYRLGGFKLSFGGRGYHNLVNSSTNGVGLLLLPTGSTQVQAQQSQKADGFNPKVSLSYDLSRAVMLYAVYSKGYRLGGPNIVPVTPLTTAKQFYKPDDVRNVETGIKSRFWHGRLTAEVAAYDIGWSDIPLVVQDSAGLFKYLVNAGNARCKGVESAIAIHPVSFLMWRSAVSYGDSRLKDDYNPNNGRPEAMAGTQLPGAPNWTITNTLVGQWDWGDYEPSVTLIHRYVGGSPSNISFTDVPIGNYQLLDVRAGLKLHDVGITAFAKNVTDTFARTAIQNQPQATGNDLQHIFIAQPRTLGVELTYNFSR
jgi:iron complex outermembrane recepter protein